MIIKGEMLWSFSKFSLRRCLYISLEYVHVDFGAKLSALTFQNYNAMPFQNFTGLQELFYRGQQLLKVSVFSCLGLL